MTQRERSTPDSGTSPAGASLWEDWYRAASPEQRQELLALARLQGVVFAHQLPAPAGPPPSAAPPPVLPALLATPPGAAPAVEPLRASPLAEDALTDRELDPAQRLA